MTGLYKNINHIVLIVSVVVLGFGHTYAQEAFRLKLLDEETNSPVAYAHVFVNNSGSSEEKIYMSDDEGVLTVALKLPSVIKVQSMGYQTHQDTITTLTNDDYIIYLKEDTFNLDEMVITSTRTSKRLKNAPVITHLVTAREIADKGIDNVQSLLETSIPGIEFQRHGTSQDVDVQGLGGRNILILVDGERMAGETRGNIDYERINTADIEKVEIIKGASSALYGSQAMGAVINIITKKSKQKIYADLSYEHKTRSERNFKNISADDPHKALKGNLDRSNNHYNLLMGFNLKSLKGKTTFDWKNTDGYTLYDTDSLVKHYVNYDTIIHTPKNTTPTGIEGGKQFSIGQKLSYQWHKYFKTEANIQYYNRHKYDFYKEDKQHDYYDDLGYGLKLQYDNQDNTIIDVTFHSDIYNKYDYKERLNKADLNYKDRINNIKAIATYQWQKHQSLLGTEFSKESLLTDMFVYGELINKSSETYTIFLQDDFKWTDQLSVIAGVRGQYNTAFSYHFTPKLSLMYALNHWRLRTNYAAGYRAPGLKELYMNWNHLDMFMIEGNPDLRPETNNYLSLSSEYTNNNFNASVTVFNNAFKNKISGQWAENQTIYRYANVSQSSLYGCDVSAKIKLNRFIVSGAYSYVNEKNRKDGVRLSAISPHTANMNVEYRYVKSDYRLNVNLGARYIGKKSFFVKDELETDQQTITDYYPVNYKGYVIGRLAVRQQLYNNANITLGIDNIFDYKAPMVTFNSYTGTGRLFFIKMNVTIDKFK